MTPITSELLVKLVERVEHRYYGKYKGQVVDNADPEGRARLRVRVPSVLGPDVVSGWAMPCVPYGGATGQGFFFIPEIEAGVWVEFEGGDLSHPVWVGTFWSKPGGEPEAPKPNDAEGVEADPQSPPTRKIIKTLKGHTIQFEDADGDEMILVVEATNGHLLVMNKDGIRLKDGANNHEVVLDAAGITVTDGANSSNSVKLESGGITVEDKNGNKVSMESGGVTVEASSVVVKSSDVTVGNGAMMEPFVLGQTFMTNVISFLISLATHTHVGNLGAPTSPPMKPIDLQVPLSGKYKMKE
jgi:uncharacterized protein involved in type VI secretion and phage assembly